MTEREVEARPVRPTLRTMADLAHMDRDEIVEGYRDGHHGEPEPGENRSDAYWHGFRNGRNDRLGVVDADQRALARDLVTNQRPPHGE